MKRWQTEIAVMKNLPFRCWIAAAPFAIAEVAGPKVHDVRDLNGANGLHTLLDPVVEQLPHLLAV